MPYFPLDTDSRSGEERPSGEFDKDEEEIPLMDETVVEGTFEDPFATESEPFRTPGSRSIRALLHSTITSTAMR